ncbi:MAG: hypothetical protein JXQ73_23955 [Phycisphaerae bacterium]|nr:hypothetical protein [Phycisphaerae bacterium]
MTTVDTPTRVAVLCDKKGAHAGVVAGYLKARGLSEVTWFSAGDADDLDEAVRHGSIDHVVVPELGHLMDAIWDGEILFDQWLSVGTRVSFVSSHAGNSTEADQATAELVFGSWQRWNRRHRRRQITAGAVLSAIALIAGFLMTLSLS